MKVPSVLLVLVVWIAATPPSHGQRYPLSYQNPNSFRNRIPATYYKPGIKNLSRVGGVYGLLSLGLPSHVVRSSRARYTPQGYLSGSNVNPNPRQVNQNVVQPFAQPRNYVPVNPSRYQVTGNFVRTPVNSFKPVSNGPHLALLLAAKARIDGNNHGQPQYQLNTGYQAPRQQQTYPAQPGHRRQPAYPVQFQQKYAPQPAQQPTYPVQLGQRPAQQPTYPAQPGHPQQPAYPATQPKYAAHPPQRPNRQPEYPLLTQRGHRRPQPNLSQNSYRQEQPSYSPNYQPQQSQYPRAGKSQPDAHRGQLPHSNQCFNTYMDQLKTFGFGFDKLGYPGDLIEKEMTTRDTNAVQLFTPSSRTRQTYPSPDPYGMCFADRKILTKISHNGGICHLIQPDTQNIQVYMCRSRDFPYNGPSQDIHKCEERYGDREVAAFCDGTGTGNKILKLKVRLPVGCGPKIYPC